jgi:hypothetical protein
MYKSFQIELSEVKKFGNNLDFGLHIRKQNKEILDNVKSQLDKYLLGNKALNADEIKKDWFPDFECHVFISHSHQDVTLVKKFANWLYNTHGIISFIDSEVWKYSEDLLKELDDKYSALHRNLYSYEKRNKSTAHVHMLLATALLQMIDKTECFIFVNTPNSIITKKVLDAPRSSTFSPWIYTEILSSKILRQQLPPRLEKVEEFATILKEDMKTTYNVETDHLIKIGYDDFNIGNDNFNIGSGKNPYKLLNHLYRKK